MVSPTVCHTSRWAQALVETTLPRVLQAYQGFARALQGGHHHLQIDVSGALGQRMAPLRPSAAPDETKLLQRA